MSTEIINSVHEEVIPTNFSESLYTRFLANLDLPSENSYQTYNRNLKQFFIYLAENRITSPDRQTILAYKQYLKDKELKPATINGYIIAVRKFFEFLELEGLYKDVSKGIRGAKVDREHKKDYLTSQQAIQLLDSIDRSTIQGLRDFAIIRLMITCGLRDIEVVRADIRDLGVKGDNNVLYLQGKGHEDKTQYVILPEETERAIRDYLKTRFNTEPGAPLFTSLSNNSRNERLSTRTISGIVKTALKSAGYDSERLTAHSLRHTAVTLALLGGEKLEEAQVFARHKDLATTMIYNHAIDVSCNTCSRTVDKALHSQYYNLE